MQRCLLRAPWRATVFLLWSTGQFVFSCIRPLLCSLFRPLPPPCPSQECLRYNRLIAVMASSLSSVQKALKGLVVMSTELDEMGTSLFNQKVPAMWEVRGGRVLRSARRSCGLCTGGRVGR